MNKQTNKDTRDKFVDLMWQVRRELGLIRAVAFAKWIGVTNAAVWRYESGRSVLSDQTMLKLLKSRQPAKRHFAAKAATIIHGPLLNAIKEHQTKIGEVTNVQ